MSFSSSSQEALESKSGELALSRDAVGRSPINADQFGRQIFHGPIQAQIGYAARVIPFVEALYQFMTAVFPETTSRLRGLQKMKLDDEQPHQETLFAQLDRIIATPLPVHIAGLGDQKAHNVAMNVVAIKMIEEFTVKARKDLPKIERTRRKSVVFKNQEDLQQEADEATEGENRKVIYQIMLDLLQSLAPTVDLDINDRVNAIKTYPGFKQKVERRSSSVSSKVVEVDQGVDLRIVNPWSQHISQLRSSQYPLSTDMVRANGDLVSLKRRLSETIGTHAGFEFSQDLFASLQGLCEDYLSSYLKAADLVTRLRDLTGHLAGSKTLAGFLVHYRALGTSLRVDEEIGRCLTMRDGSRLDIPCLLTSTLAEYIEEINAWNLLAGDLITQEKHGTIEDVNSMLADLTEKRLPELSKRSDDQLIETIAGQIRQKVVGRISARYLAEGMRLGLLDQVHPDDHAAYELLSQLIVLVTELLADGDSSVNCENVVSGFKESIDVLSTSRNGVEDTSYSAQAQGLLFTFVGDLEHSQSFAGIKQLIVWLKQDLDNLAENAGEDTTLIQFIDSAHRIVDDERSDLFAKYVSKVTIIPPVHFSAFESSNKHQKLLQATQEVRTAIEAVVSLKDLPDEDVQECYHYISGFQHKLIGECEPVAKAVAVVKQYKLGVLTNAHSGLLGNLERFLLTDDLVPPVDELGAQTSYSYQKFYDFHVDKIKSLVNAGLPIINRLKAMVTVNEDPSVKMPTYDPEQWKTRCNELNGLLAEFGDGCSLREAEPLIGFDGERHIEEGNEEDEMKDSQTSQTSLRSFSKAPPLLSEATTDRPPPPPPRRSSVVKPPPLLSEATMSLSNEPVSSLSSLFPPIEEVQETQSSSVPVFTPPPPPGRPSDMPSSSSRSEDEMKDSQTSRRFSEAPPLVSKAPTGMLPPSSRPPPPPPRRSSEVPSSSSRSGDEMKDSRRPSPPPGRPKSTPTSQQSSEVLVRPISQSKETQPSVLAGGVFGVQLKSSDEEHAKRQSVKGAVVSQEKEGKPLNEFQQKLAQFGGGKK